MVETATFVTIEEAQRIVLEHVGPLGTVEVPLAVALGMTLAADVACDTDVPIFDCAMMDGYAARSQDLLRSPVVLEVVGKVAAGGAASQALGPGQAVQINTGAPIPAGADVVVRVEDTVLSDDGRTVTVVSTAPYPPEKNICRAGTYVRTGAVVLRAGTRMGASQIAAAATAGAARVIVHRRPRVGVLVTGDEIVEAATRPTGSQIRNSNGPALMALLAEAGLEPISLGIVNDDKAALDAVIRRGLEYDCLCLTGGVSMGTLDYVPEVLERRGVRFHFRKMSTKPGKPTIFGTTDAGCAVFALPGNPVSAFVGYWMLVRPALAAMQGRPRELPPLLQASLEGTCRPTEQRQSYWPVKIRVGDDGRFVATALSWGGSGDPFGMVEANGLVVRRPGMPAAASGEAVEVVMLNWS